MPEVSVAKAKRVRSLSIPLNDEGESLAIKWNPANLTQEVWDEMMVMNKKQKAGEDINPFETARVIVVPLMSWWDLQEDDHPEVQYPITPENVAGFGLDFVLAAANVIQADFKIGPDTKKGSGDGLSIQT